MNELVIKMAEKLAFQLRKQQKLTSCITVKIRYANFDTHTLQKKIAYTAFDHMIINTAKELFKKIYQRRMMIRLIGIRLSALAGGTQQLSLFEDTSEMANLYYTMDKIRKRFGNNAVGRAVGEKRQ